MNDRYALGRLSEKPSLTYQVATLEDAFRIRCAAHNWGRRRGLKVQTTWDRARLRLTIRRV